MGIPDNIINGIVSVLVPRVFVPGDEIMHAKEIGKEFYIIEKGRVHISSPNDASHMRCSVKVTALERVVPDEVESTMQQCKVLFILRLLELEGRLNETMEAFPERKKPYC